jgi:hypothetical protein
MRASLRVMASPRPVPPNFCAVVASAWQLLEQLCLLLCGHPDAGVGDGELDEVAAIAHPASASLTSPALVNLQALLRRLSKRRNRSRTVLPISSA